MTNRDDPFERGPSLADSGRPTGFEKANRVVTSVGIGVGWFFRALLGLMFIAGGIGLFAASGGHVWWLALLCIATGILFFIPRS